MDLSALRADDALLDAIAAAPLDRKLPIPDGSAGALAALLLEWRRDIDSEPVPELVSLERAGHLLHTAARKPRRMPLFAPLAGAAAVLVIVMSAVAIAAHTAVPGTPLWGVSKVLYAERAQSVEAAQTANDKLNDASQALAAGDITKARGELAAARTNLPAVRPEDGLAGLQARQSRLQQELAAAPAATAPSTPSPSTSTSSTAPVAPPGVSSPPTTAPPTPTTTVPPTTTTTAPPTTTTAPPTTTATTTTKPPVSSRPTGPSGSPGPTSPSPPSPSPTLRSSTGHATSTGSTPGPVRRPGPAGESPV